MKFVLKVISEITLLAILFFNVFVSKKFDASLTIVSLIIFLVFTILLNGYRKPYNRDAFESYLVVCGLSIVIMGILYSIGLKSGFQQSYSCLFKNYIKASTWINVFIIVILQEIVRYVMIDINERKKWKSLFLQILIFGSFILLDVTITTKVYDFTVLSQIYEFFALVLVQSISKNLLLNYVSRRHGYGPTIGYRFIMDLYIYFLPLIPRINTFIEGVILLVFPYVVYAFLREMDNNVKPENARKNKEKDGILTFIFAIFFAILVALVSREFKYCMIAIGSESMTGTANKGDAVIYKKFDYNKDKLTKGDIIVFQKNGLMIVHRINDIYSIDGYNAYQTKGDANNAPDNWVVNHKDVIGIVNARVPIIAWPSVLLNELFN